MELVKQAPSADDSQEVEHRPALVGSASKAESTNRDAPASDAPASPAETADQPPPKKRQRKRMFLIFGGLLALAGASWWVWVTFIAADAVSTENAYTNVEVAQVTPLVGAPVKRVLVVNSQHVEAGDVLVELDDTDLRLAVEQAEAALGQARRKVRQIMANDDNLASQEEARTADVATARADLVRAKADLAKALLDQGRAQKLIVTNAIATQTLDNANTIVEQSRAAVSQAEARITSAQASSAAAAGARHANQVLFDNTTVDTNPEVVAAQVKLNQAKVDLARAVIRAPVAGIVDQRRVAVGQRVQAGTAIMVVVPLQEMYVDANFKEVQLSRVKPGQPVELTSDLYGSDVVYHGRVAGFSGGTGSAFAAIPAQNATGNWIKVVQRLPVRITLDPKEIEQHPLRVGLSMHTTIDLSGAD
ncbi:MAG: HlyD family efflux transporter periplasmic adaptor subunit [Pseudolabrys sp.]|nr:HlyD family efflux transporter periplasmic adaptor subunit [Pseudolabrys sp.]